MKPSFRMNKPFVKILTLCQIFDLQGVNLDMRSEVVIQFCFFASPFSRFHLVIDPLFPHPLKCCVGVVNPLLQIAKILHLSLPFNFGFHLAAVTSGPFPAFHMILPLKGLMNFSLQTPSVSVLRQQMVTGPSLEAQGSDSQVVAFRLPCGLQSESSSLA